MSERRRRRRRRWSEIRWKVEPRAAAVKYKYFYLWFYRSAYCSIISPAGNSGLRLRNNFQITPRDLGSSDLRIFGSLDPRLSAPILKLLLPAAYADNRDLIPARLASSSHNSSQYRNYQAKICAEIWAGLSGPLKVLKVDKLTLI